MDVLRHWANDMPRADMIDEIETLRGRLCDAEFRERGLHEALRKETDQLAGAVEALRGVLSGRIIRDETENGDPILLDLSTEPATVVRLDRLGGQ